MKKILVFLGTLFLAAVVNADIDIIKASGVKGGLVVQVGCGDSQLLLDLRANDSYLVHGLDTDQKNVDTARKYIQSKGLYGKVSVNVFDGKHLPYADNLVNLIVVTSYKLQVTEEEIERVLAPRGVVLIKGNLKPRNKSGAKAPVTCNLKPQSPSGLKGWTMFKKPVPKEIDEWTHYLHGADGNAVADDTVIGQPRSLQWAALPKWGRSHEELNSMTACVTAKGRIFYIEDQAPVYSIRFIADWKLVARDAFNGIKLWERDIPVWVDHLRHFRSGPVHLPRRLVAYGDVVYVTLGLGQPAVALDAATGEIIRTYKDTEFTDEIIYDKGVLYLVVGTSENKRKGEGLHQRGAPKPTNFRYVKAFDADSGKELWKVDTPKGEFILPLSLAARGEKVFFQSTGGLVCIDATSGKQLWKALRETPNKRMGFSGPTLVVNDELVILADKNVEAKPKREEAAGTVPATDSVEWGIHGWYIPDIPRGGSTSVDAYDINTGKHLWQIGAGQGYNSPIDIFIARGLVWIGVKGYDLKTGKVMKEHPQKGTPVGMIHPRCHRRKATENFILWSKSGVEFLDLEKGWVGNNSWIRGTCQYGIMPANGMIYAPQDACACFNKVKLQGFLALAPAREAGSVKREAKERLEKGSAYGKTPQSAIRNPQSDWPMYRHDSKRSGAVATKIDSKLEQLWISDIGGKLTQPVIADGQVVVASVDEHTVYALDMKSGKQVWSYIAGGRIDSSPSLYKGLVLFGSSDGWVYCLRASDGELAWRFRAAPEERLIYSFGQLESAWPVPGAVLIQNDIVYFTAGRNTYVDGGLKFYGLNPGTGEKLFEKTICFIDQETNEQTGKEGRPGYYQFDMEGSLNDVLTGDGEYVYLKHYCFDKTGEEKDDPKSHLFSVTGFLGEEWFIRSYWIYGLDAFSGFFQWARTIREKGGGAPTARIMSFDDKDIYGYGRVSISGGKMGHRAEVYHLFARSLDGSRKSTADPEDRVDIVDVVQPAKNEKDKEMHRRYKGALLKMRRMAVWTQPSTMHVRAMVLAGDQLIVAGVPDLGKKNPEELFFDNENEARSAFDGGKGSLLRIVSTVDGSTKSEIKLPAMPTFDGMSAANGKLFVSLKNGEVVCWE
ncbi:PQQ-binding-like beta-propeller repeat protein [Verrucomicrobiota bacterium]